ncbi:helix-hairpin-helix domain-containing protein [Bernardetia sp.]|uniref:helix-hairpin-helix domain-containing protein n=1 Tax=Bernardetia sp. TaxID=1937974 RepID=UPI0025C0FA55|nr:helix-hairpin-helix domain-containing protein [Bernardetia sp.]
MKYSFKNIRAEFSELVKNNSNFSRREANGMLVLSLCFLFPIVAIIYERFQSAEEIDSKIVGLQAERADSLLAVLEMQQPLDRETKLAMLEIRPFDPNKLSVAQWQAIGVKPWVAKRVVNAVNKKYVFLQKNDLEKFNGFPKEEYERLKEYIDLPDTVDKKEYYRQKYDNKKYASYDKNKYEKKDYKKYDNKGKENNYTSNYEKKEYKKYTPKVIEKFDLNTADTATLKQIRGIGEKTSLWIVSNRNKLGGFHSIEQTKEISILSDKAFEELKKYAFISPSFKVKKININTADYETLKKHSYISWKAASTLLKYKKQHGNYKSLDDIRKSRAIKEEQLQKLIPYLEF